MTYNKKAVQIPEPALAKFLFADTRIAFLWLAVRLYAGWEWLMAGWEKLGNPAWTGEGRGVAVRGFLEGALSKMSGPHPDVSGWYGAFIRDIALPNADIFSCLVIYGEILVGIALILGILTGIAAFFGTFMNVNFLLAGTVSINPVLLLLQVFLMLAWRTAGWFGADRYLLPILGTPWSPGVLFEKKPPTTASIGAGTP